MGDWKLTDAQAKTLREYLLRGGFIYMDDFWGAEEYARFDESMSRVFPDRPVVEIENADPIFHVVYDLDDRYQVPGSGHCGGGRGWMAQRAAGTKAHWMGIYDDHNRADGRDVVQQRRRRFLGVGRRARVPGKILRTRASGSA